MSMLRIVSHTSTGWTRKSLFRVPVRTSAARWRNGHPAYSVGTVRRIVQGFKDKTNDKAEFWIDFKEDKILIRYFPVYDDDGVYMVFWKLLGLSCYPENRRKQTAAGLKIMYYFQKMKGGYQSPPGPLPRL